jgi:hypothetical protein
LWFCGEYLLVHSKLGLKRAAHKTEGHKDTGAPSDIDGDKIMLLVLFFWLTFAIPASPFLHILFGRHFLLELKVYFSRV